MPRSAELKAAKKTIAIVGLPNTGKSQLFHKLTGVYNIVANYPHTTVEEKRANYKLDGHPWEVIDTPGLHCLYIHSEEDLSVREKLFSTKPDVLVQCIDGQRLKQSLVLTIDLLELGIPLVVTLSAIDENPGAGTWLDSAKLSELLGVPVVETAAMFGYGIRELKEAIQHAGVAPRPFRYDDALEKRIGEIESLLDGTVSYTWKTASLLLLRDRFILGEINKRTSPEVVTQIREKTEDMPREPRSRLADLMINRRHQWVNEVTEQVLQKQKMIFRGFFDHFARLSRHPVYGLFILVFIMAISFFLVVYVAGFLETGLSYFIVDPCVAAISSLFPTGLLNEFLVGVHGVLTLGLFNALCTVLPILSVFYLLLSALEDVGYMPNLCVLSRRFFGLFGLSGKSLMSIILAFGCKTMATLTTKSLTSFREKLIANYLIAFAVPCAAQFALQLAIVGRVGVWGVFLTLGIMGVIFVAVGLILNNLLKQEIASDYIQVLPPARIPRPRAVLLKTWYRVRWFMQEALPIFMVTAVALFTFDKVGLLGSLKKLLEPIILGWLGLTNDIVDVLLLCIARREVAAGQLLRIVDSGSLTTRQVIVAGVLTTLFVPCAAHIVALSRQIGVKWTAILLPTIPISVIMICGLLNILLNSIMGG